MLEGGLDVVCGEAVVPHHVRLQLEAIPELNGILECFVHQVTPRPTIFPQVRS